MRQTALLLITILLAGCFGTSKISNQNLYYIYDRDASMLHPEYSIQHLNDSVSRLFFRIDASELLYTKKGDVEEFTAKFSLNFKLLPSFESKEILDSMSIYLDDKTAEPKSKEIISYIDFNARQKGDYLLVVRLSDLNRNQTTKDYLHVDKRNLNSRQNFFFSPPGAQYPYFRNYIGETEKFTLKHRGEFPIYYVRYYQRDFPLAAPPFAVAGSKPFDYSADSLFLEKTGDTFQYKTTGIYHFQVDTVNKDGMTVFRFPNNFPKVSTPEDLLGPLRYLTTRQEFRELEESENLKEAIDEFWLDLAGNRQRARELIKKYYSRVQDANRYFTSYVEGWKTDRGLIYIIYGPPNVIYKNSNSESWTYGEENNLMSLNFTFVKVENPFTPKDFILNRSPIYKSSWYRAVDTWRKGRVYTDN